MDTWRQQILADIGIPTWIRRELLPAPDIAKLMPDAAPGVSVASPSAANPAKANPAKANPASANANREASKPVFTPASSTPGRTRDPAAENALAALSQSLDSGSSQGRKAPSAAVSTPTPAAAPSHQTQAHPVNHPEVACLWAGDAVLFCPPSELVGQVRLAKDILASAANNWTQAAEQLVFRWAELQASGFDPAEADRALLAFAEKRIEVCAARWVLSTPSLQSLLAQLVLPTGARLLGLAQLANLSREAQLKQQLWQALGQSREAPANDG